MTQRGIKRPEDKNPAARVDRYKEHAPEIRFLTLNQIEEQFEALSENLQLQAECRAEHSPRKRRVTKCNSRSDIRHSSRSLNK